MPSKKTVKPVTEVTLHFTKPVSLNINGNLFEGKDVVVPVEFEEAVRQNAVDAYGEDVLA